LCSLPSAAAATVGVVPYNQTIYQFTAADIDGQMVSMNKYRGKVVMIVNVASA